MPNDDLDVSLRRLTPAEVRAFHDGAHLALTWALSLLPGAARIPGSPLQPAEVLAAFSAVHDKMTMSALMAAYCPADTADTVPPWDVTTDLVVELDIPVRAKNILRNAVWTRVPPGERAHPEPTVADVVELLTWRAIRGTRNCGALTEYQLRDWARREGITIREGA